MRTTESVAFFRSYTFISQRTSLNSLRSRRQQKQRDVKGNLSFDYNVGTSGSGADEISVEYAYNVLREEILREANFVQERFGPVIQNACRMSGGTYYPMAACSS
jgi:hypothetical protein